LDFVEVSNILVGSTIGFSLRLFIKYKFQKWKVFSLDNSLVVNFLASLFLGIFIPLNVNNKNLLLFFFVGFLGCFSTFSSFIYRLFNLIQKKKYLSFFLYYFGILTLSALFFCVGYLINVIIQN
tara:strand:- start:280 stop:651 length:372 start_codon:yes stop_codon:yes gene_type:complete